MLRKTLPIILTTVLLLVAQSNIAAQTRQKKTQPRAAASKSNSQKTDSNPTEAEGKGMEQKAPTAPSSQPVLTQPGDEAKNAAPTALEANITEPFDPAVGKLPPAFRGHSHTKLVQLLWDRRQQLKKGEFETTQAYRDRVARLHEQPLLGALGEKSVYAFVEADPSDFSYDADSQTMRVNRSLTARRAVALEKDDREAFREIPTATLEAKITGIEYYSGTNIYGAVREVKQIESIRWALLINDYQRFNSISKSGASDWNLSLSFSIPAEAARKAKPDMRLLYVCRLVPPHIVVESGRLKPTFNHPKEYDELTLNLPVELIEARCFNKSTGEVYAMARSRSESEEAAYEELQAIDKCLAALSRIPARVAERRMIFQDEYARLHDEVATETARAMAVIRDDKMKETVLAALDEFSFAREVWRSWNYEPLVGNSVMSKGWVKDKLISAYGLKPRGLPKIIYLEEALLAVFAKANPLLRQATAAGNERKKKMLSEAAGPKLATARGLGASQLEGIWTLTIAGLSGASNKTLVVQASNGKPTVTLQSNEQLGIPASLEVNGGEFSLTYSEVSDNQPIKVMLKGRVEGSNMSGKMTFSQSPGTEIKFTGIRK
jgi:hypothetical protein